jgi:hypothetical protein
LRSYKNGRYFGMKKSWRTEEKIICGLKQMEAGRPAIWPCEREA